ncbi:unnamed protein product, partial [Ostreobium quekettii]
SSFIWDLLAAFPYATLILSAGGKDSFETWWQLPKLLHVRVLYRYYIKQLADVRADTLTGGLRRLFPFIIAISHVMACIWWFLGRLKEQRWSEGSGDEDPSWISHYEGLGTDNIASKGSLAEQYLLSFYYITVTLSANGLVGRMLPQNIWEIFFVCVLMVITLTLYAFVLGEISNLVMKQ